MEHKQPKQTTKNIGRRFNSFVIQSAFIDDYGERRYNCLCDCGKEFTVHVKDASRKVSCGHARTKLALLVAKKGISAPVTHPDSQKENRIPPSYRYKTRAGYIEVKTPENHIIKSETIFEHRLVMEKMIGRFLKPNETVHHKNLKRDDNREKNLELWASRHPKGARIEDLIEYAIEILQDYAPDRLS